MTIFAVIGLYKSLGLTFRTLNFSYRHFLRPRKNHLADYGGGWALVTGASDGIGEAYSHQLAKQGINIILVSRSQEKMDKVAKDLESTYGVQTQTVVFDF